MKLSEHPTVKKIRDAGTGTAAAATPALLDAAWLRDLCREAGADDAGFVALDRAELDVERPEVLRFFPAARALISVVCRMNREPIRSPARSVANLEFHHSGDEVNEVARRIVRALEKEGVRAVNPSMGFPMEMDRFPGRTWVVSHKTVAVAAGLGRMGIHRNLIHPRFGNFVLLGTVLVDRAVTEESRPLDFNPCLECKLCVAACPVGAIAADGHFNFSACYTHNYREFMSGFTSWAEQVAESKDARDYRRRVTDPESASLWQSLSFGANYKAAYCMAVCPAGEDAIGPYLADAAAFRRQVVEPLVAKEETVYVVPGSDAETHAARRFPHKTLRRVHNGLRPRSIRGFLAGLPLAFQRRQAEGLDAVYHFTFRGSEAHQATVILRDRSVRVEEGHVGTADLHLRADSATWLGYLAGERSLLWALLTRRIGFRGPPRLLRAFARCFPS